MAYLELTAIRPPAQKFVPHTFNYVDRAVRLSHIHGQQAFEEVFECCFLH